MTNKTVDTRTITITERLNALGYIHAADDLTKVDGRHTIYDADGYAIDRLNSKEAVEFCGKFGG